MSDQGVPADIVDGNFTAHVSSVTRGKHTFYTMLVFRGKDGDANFYRWIGPRNINGSVDPTRIAPTELQLRAFLNECQVAATSV